MIFDDFDIDSIRPQMNADKFQPTTFTTIFLFCFQKNACETRKSHKKKLTKNDDFQVLYFAIFMFSVLLIATDVYFKKVSLRKVMSKKAVLK